MTLLQAAVKQRTDIDEAAAAWEAGTDSMMEFCILASNIVGQREEGRTKQLGDRIHRSEDTVERYARAGLLYCAYETTYGGVDSERVRDALDWQYWVAIAQLWSKNCIDLRGVKHWFDEAIDNRWSYEKFRSMLPASDGKSVWKKSAKAWMKQSSEFLKNDLLNSPALDVDPKEYKKVVRAMKLLNARMERAIA